MREFIHHCQTRFNPELQGWFNIHKSFSITQHFNKSKDKNHFIISIDTVKAFNKIQNHCMINYVRKLEVEGLYLNIIKALHDKPAASIILNREKLKPFLLK
jgi:hypothetical protein